MTDAPFSFEQKERSRRITRLAIEKGRLVRPERCQNCGEIPRPRADGKAAVQCHHPDYSDPMNVEWLCSPCHRKVTPITKHGRGGRKGSQHSQSKLTEADVVQIRALHARGERGVKRLAREYGVSNPVIRDVIYRRGWTHV
jgi:hypothetical protein